MNGADSPPAAGDDPGSGIRIDRREAMIAALSITAAMAVPDTVSVAQSPESAAAHPAVPIRFTVNGRRTALVVDPRTSTLDLLREQIGLMGAKKGCDHGQCGACTIHINGRRVVSCLTPAVQLDGAELLTIEGLSGESGALHPMQQAFIDHDALQCGYCTPGQIMAAVACVKEGNATSPERIREYMSGNLCRCGAYVGIGAAIRAASSKMQDG